MEQAKIEKRQSTTDDNANKGTVEKKKNQTIREEQLIDLYAS